MEMLDLGAILHASAVSVTHEQGSRNTTYFSQFEIGSPNCICLILEFGAQVSSMVEEQFWASQCAYNEEAKEHFHIL